MTIAIDCRFASTLSGLGRYTRELARELARELVKHRTADMCYILLVQSKDEEWLLDLPQVRLYEVAIPYYSLAEQLQFPSMIRDTGADLLFSPHFNVPLSCPIPFVVTIHDLILHRYPNSASFLKRLAYRTLIKHAIQKAESIIAISNFVKKEITDAYGVSLSSKIHVIREGVSPLYHPLDAFHSDAVRKKYGIERPFFLYVGNAKEHKNLPFLIDAFTKAGDTGHDLVLVCGGKEAEALPLPPHVKRIKGVADMDLPALYSCAEACVTASLYEGFCLPVAEALACGCPVIATNLPVIEEIASGHAFLIEPTTEAFTKAFTQSYQHTDPFIVGTWEKTAQETASIFQALLQH